MFQFEYITPALFAQYDNYHGVYRLEMRISAAEFRPALLMHQVHKARCASGHISLPLSLSMCLSVCLSIVSENNSS